MYQGLTIEQYIANQGFKDREEWQKPEVNRLRKTRKAGLVLAELSKVEKVEATAETELVEHINLYKQQYANSPEVAKKQTTRSTARHRKTDHNRKPLICSLN